MDHTHRIKLSRAPIEDDDIAVRDTVRRAIGLVAAGFLAAMLIGAGITIYVAVTSRAAAEEPRFEVMGGQCRYGKVGNYVWFNDHYQHALDMTAACSMMGISRLTGSFGWSYLGWRVAYVDFGTARTNAVFPMVDTEQPSHPGGSNCNAATLSGCLGRGIGEQTARGISAGVIAERDIWGARAGAELGLFVYEGAWRVAITPHPPGNFAPMRFEWDGYQATPFIGATLRYEHGVAMVRAYSRIRAAEHGCGGCSGVAGKMATQALLGISVPF